VVDIKFGHVYYTASSLLERRKVGEVREMEGEVEKIPKR